MAYAVYAVAAAEFMAAFYDALFSGQPVSRAVVAGRRQMQQRCLRPSPKGLLPLADWCVPVHYARREVKFSELTRQERPKSLEQILDGLRQPRPAPLPEGVHQEGGLEARDGIFFGRDREFLELERALRLEHVILIWGGAGNGKTEVAKGFARWLQVSGGLDDPQLVFFHSFEPGIATFGLQGVLASIGWRLFGAEFAQRDHEARRTAVLRLLQSRRLLLIWDNFESVCSMADPQGITPALDASGREEIRSFLQAVRQRARGGVILTSRSPEPWLGDLHRLELGALDAQTVNEYADRLLAASPAAQARRQEDACKELFERLGGHPLSLRLILPRLADAPAAELVRGLRGEGELPAGFSAGEGKSESLGACMHYSFQHLAPEDQARLPALTLCEGVADVKVLAILSQVDGVPKRFAGVAREAWKSTLDACVRIGLLSELGLGCYRLHPALPSYLQGWWQALAGESHGAEHEAAMGASIAAYAALGSWLNQQIKGGDAGTAFTLLRLEQRSLGRAAAAALARGRFAQAQDVLQPLNELWDATGMFEEARAWVDRVRELTEDAQGRPPSLDTAEGGLWLFLINSQANRHVQQQQLDAAEAAYHSLREMLEGSEGTRARRHLAVAYHNLGRVAQLRGDLAAAETWCRKSLEINEALGNRPGMASSYHLLGIVAQLRGDLAAAETWYQKSLEIFEELDDRPHMAQSYHQLGVVAQVRGDLAGAETWYQKSLEIKEALGNRPGMASSYHQLGMVAQDRGDLAAAETWYRKSLEINEALGNRPGIALTYCQLGLLAEACGDSPGALAWMVRCVTLFEAFPHPATGPGPKHLVRLTAKLGLDALAASWQRVTGKPLPEDVRQFVERSIARAAGMPDVE